MPRRRHATTQEPMPTQRQTRQSVNGRSQANYDMKIHPIDEFSRPAHWARHHGLGSPSRHHSHSETEDDEDSISLSSGTEEDPELAEADDSPLQRSRSPDPNAVRRSERSAARIHREYRANVHPNDDRIPGYRRKRRVPAGDKAREKSTPTMIAESLESDASPSPPPATTQKRKRWTPTPVNISSDQESTESDMESVIPYQREPRRECIQAHVNPSDAVIFPAFEVSEDEQSSNDLHSKRPSTTPVDSGHVPSPSPLNGPPASESQLVASETRGIAAEDGLAMIIDHLAEYAECEPQHTEQQREYREVQDGDDEARYPSLTRELSPQMHENSPEVQTAITVLSSIRAIESLPGPGPGPGSDSDSSLRSPSELGLSPHRPLELSHTPLPALNSTALNNSPANTHDIPSFSPSSPTSHERSSSPLKPTSKDPTLAPAGHLASAEVLNAAGSDCRVESSPASKIHSSPTPLRPRVPLQPPSWNAINSFPRTYARQAFQDDDEDEERRKEQALFRPCDERPCDEISSSLELNNKYFGNCGPRGE